MHTPSQGPSSSLAGHGSHIWGSYAHPQRSRGISSSDSHMVEANSTQTTLFATIAVSALFSATGLHVGSNPAENNTTTTDQRPQVTVMLAPMAARIGTQHTRRHRSKTNRTICPTHTFAQCPEVSDRIYGQKAEIARRSSCCSLPELVRLKRDRHVKMGCWWFQPSRSRSSALSQHITS